MPFAYKVVKADNRQEALEKAGFVIGQYVRITDVRVSSAGAGTYTIMPVIEPADQEKDDDAETS